MKSWVVAASLLAALLIDGRVRAQDTPSPGRDLWEHRGCWNCHGSDGAGSRRGRPAIAKSPLPLRLFIGRVRLPIWNMPPHTPMLVSDADLTVIYDWLGGFEAVAAPPTATFSLERTTDSKAGQAEVALALTAPDFSSLQYRVRLITNSDLQDASRALEYQPSGTDSWSKLILDESGEAVLGKDSRLFVADEKQPGVARARLRMAAPSVRSLVVIEALDYTQPDKPVVAAIGTAIVKTS